MHAIRQAIIQATTGRLGLAALVLASMLLLAPEGTRAEEQQAFKAYRNNEVAEARPKRPVKIKFKRTSSGEYSWELEGESADEITEADRRLREYVEQSGLKHKK